MHLLRWCLFILEILKERVKHVDKKTITIIVLSLIIIGLCVCIGYIVKTTDNGIDDNLEKLRIERDTAIESNRVMEIENKRIREESEGLRRDNQESADYNTELEYQNNKYKRILDDLGRITGDTEKLVSDYGENNQRFRDWIRQNSE